MRPNNQKIKIVFYKLSGKWYGSGEAIVNHYMFEDKYKQDIVNTQNVLMDGWQDHENFVVVVSGMEDEEGFNEGLFQPNAFKGIKKHEA